MLYRLTQEAGRMDNVNIVSDVNLPPADGDNSTADHIKNTTKETHIKKNMY